MWKGVLRTCVESTAVFFSFSITDESEAFQEYCLLFGLNPGGGEIFCTRPDRPWSPPSLLHNGYRIIPGIKRSGRGVNHPTHLGPRLKQGWAMSLVPIWAFITNSRVKFTFIFITHFLIEGGYARAAKRFSRHVFRLDSFLSTRGKGRDEVCWMNEEYCVSVSHCSTTTESTEANFYSSILNDQQKTSGVR